MTGVWLRGMQASFVGDEVNNIIKDSIDSVLLNASYEHQKVSTRPTVHFPESRAACVFALQFWWIFADLGPRSSQVGQWTSLIVEAALSKLASLQKPFKYIGAPPA